MTRPRTRQRDKLAPDPGVRRAILAAASKSVREQGVRGLSIAAVLDRAQLSTRAFYRHFESKDQLVAAVFLEMARVEMRRLRRKMANAATAVDAVAAWIDGRLDLAFDENIKSDLRYLSSEAQSQIFASPDLVQPAYADDARAAHRTASARPANTACSTTSIRSAPHSRSRAWCGHAPNGNGPQAIAIAPILANALCVSACAGWAWHQKSIVSQQHH